MGKVFVNENTLLDIAIAIRKKLSTTELYKPGDMPAAINDITTMPMVSSVSASIMPQWSAGALQHIFIIPSCEVG